MNKKDLIAMLNTEFDDVEVSSFALDNFYDVYNSFGRGMGKDEKIELLVDYCIKNKLVDKLLTLI